MTIPVATGTTHTPLFTCTSRRPITVSARGSSASGVKYLEGPSAGSYDLASKAEILDYYDQVMQRRFLPSGRVTWLPMSEYRRGPDGSHHVMSLLGGSRIEVVVTKKLVDATQVRTKVPATHGPRYSVMSQVQLIPVNRLPEIRRPHPCYTVVGAGKTGHGCMLVAVG